MSVVTLGICGPHSTGKSTTLLKAKDLLEVEGLRVAYVAEVARQCPFPILRHHTVDSTLWIVVTTIAQEIEIGRDNDVVLVDRPVMDAMGYYIAALEHRGEVLPLTDLKCQVLLQLVEKWSESYDAVFCTQINPTIPIASDRDGDVAFRARVGAALDDAIKRFRPDARKLSFDSDASANLIHATALQRLRRGESENTKNS